MEAGRADHPARAARLGQDQGAPEPRSSRRVDPQRREPVLDEQLELLWQPARDRRIDLGRGSLDVAAAERLEERHGHRDELEALRGDRWDRVGWHGRKLCVHYEPAARP